MLRAGMNISYKSTYPNLRPALIVKNDDDNMSVCSDATCATARTVFSTLAAEKSTSFECLQSDDIEYMPSKPEQSTILKKLKAELKKRRRNDSTSSDEDVSQISQIFDEMSQSIDLSLNEKPHTGNGLRRVQSLHDPHKSKIVDSPRFGSSGYKRFTFEDASVAKSYGVVTNLPIVRHIPITITQEHEKKTDHDHRNSKEPRRSESKKDRKILYLPPEIQIKRADPVTALIEQEDPQRRSSVGILCTPENSLCEDIRRASFNVPQDCTKNMKDNLQDINQTLKELKEFSTANSDTIKRIAPKAPPKNIQMPPVIIQQMNAPASPKRKENLPVMLAPSSHFYTPPQSPNKTDSQPATPNKPREYLCPIIAVPAVRTPVTQRTEECQEPSKQQENKNCTEVTPTKKQSSNPASGQASLKEKIAKLERESSDEKSVSIALDIKTNIKDIVRNYERQPSEDRSEILLSMSKDLPKKTVNTSENYPAEVKSIKDRILNFDRNEPEKSSSSVPNKPIKKQRETAVEVSIPSIRSKISAFERAPSEEKSISVSLPEKRKNSITDDTPPKTDTRSVASGTTSDNNRIRSRINGYLKSAKGMDTSEEKPRRRTSVDVPTNSDVRSKIDKYERRASLDQSISEVHSKPEPEKPTDVEKKFQEILKSINNAGPNSASIVPKKHSGVSRSNSTRESRNSEALEKATMYTSLYVPSEKAVERKTSVPEFDNLLKEMSVDLIENSQTNKQIRKERSQESPNGELSKTSDPVMQKSSESTTCVKNISSSTFVIKPATRIVVEENSSESARLVSSEVKHRVSYKSYGFVSGMGSKRMPKKVEIEYPEVGFCEVSTDISASFVKTTFQQEGVVILMAVRASFFDRYPGLPGVFLTLNLRRQRRLTQGMKFEDLEIYKPNVLKESVSLEKAASFEEKKVLPVPIDDVIIDNVAEDETPDDITPPADELPELDGGSDCEGDCYSYEEEEEEEAYLTCDDVSCEEHLETWRCHSLPPVLRRQDAMEWSMTEQSENEVEATDTLTRTRTIQSEVYLSNGHTADFLTFCIACEAWHQKILVPVHRKDLWKRPLSGEPRTQSITMKQKRQHECFAIATIEAPVIAKESANKTIIVDLPERQIITEKVELSVQATKQRESNVNEGNLEESQCVSEETSQLVEEQLREISKQAEELAKSVKKQASRVQDFCHSVNSDSDIMSTSASSSFIRLDTIPDDEAIDCRMPSLHKSTSTPRVCGLNPSLEVRPIIKRMVPTVGVDKQSMVDRLSKGIADLTAGSQDRLQRWKHKLQTGRRQKDASEPPPSNRNMFVQNNSTSEVNIDWTNNGTSQSVHRPRPLHCSKSLQNASSLGNVPALSTQTSLDMEHRTLKSRENRAGSHGFAPKHSMSSAANKLDSLSHPARILPISGLRPDGELIKPIAFRPVGGQPMEYRRQSTNTQRNIFSDRPINAHTTVPAVPTAAVPTGPNIVRPKGMYQPSTSFCPIPVHNNLKQTPPVENEYDTVHEFYEKEKHSDVGSNTSDYSAYNGSLGNKFSTSQQSSGGSPGNTVSKMKSFNSSTSSSASRQSSGVHVTPSPSDSGIVDFESIIRDKENELREVRTTMEQNEEIIVKVYQEKERGYKEEIANLRQRLAASEKGENALRSQLASCQRQTESMRVTIEGIRSEKNDLMRKCAQLERDLNMLRNERTHCAKCSSSCNGRPVPAPRTVKETTPSDDLRDEVSQLRREVSTLKDALNNVALFNKKVTSNNNNNNHKTNNGFTNGVVRTPSEPRISNGSDRLI